MPCKVFFICYLTFFFPGSSCVKMVNFFIWKRFLFIVLARFFQSIKLYHFSVEDWLLNWGYGAAGSQCLFGWFYLFFFSIRICNVVTNFVTTLQIKHSTSYKTNETYKIIKKQLAKSQDLIPWKKDVQGTNKE